MKRTDRPSNVSSRADGHGPVRTIAGNGNRRPAVPVATMRKGDLVASAAGSRPVGGAGITIPGADRLVWYFMRLSGALLIILAGGHIVITHYLNVPSETTFAFVTDRWANPYWRTFDWLLLDGGACGMASWDFATRSRTTFARRWRARSRRG